MSRPASAPDGRLAYGIQPLQFGDLRLPAGRGPHPVAVVVHGGFWRSLYNLDHIGHLCTALTAAGYATWSIEYRRLGDAGGGWPNTFLDTANACAHLRNLAGQYDLDLARVFTIGHSAGGHLALWLAGLHRLPSASPLAVANPLVVCGAVSLAGVSNLQRAWELALSRGVVSDLMLGSPSDVPEHYAGASPFELLPLGIPQVLVHGAADEIVPLEISQGYLNAALSRGDVVRLFALPGMGHFELIDPNSVAWPTVLQAVRMICPVSTG